MLNAKSRDLGQFTLMIALIYEELQRPDRQFDAIEAWLNAAVVFWRQDLTEFRQDSQKEL